VVARGGRASVDDDQTAEKSRFWRGWFGTYALLLTLAVAWILVTPPIGGPDEHSHAVKAAAAVTGQLAGDMPARPNGGARMVEVPGRLDMLSALPCFAFRPELSAECSPSFEGSTRVRPVETRAGVSPPLYYVLVGAPIRIMPSLDGLYLSRLLSAAIACAMVTTALRLALAARSPFLTVATLVSWTPNALSLTGIISPSSLEISTAILVWVAGILLVRPGPLPDGIRRWLPWTFAGAASLFALSRQLSPLYLGCIAACLALGAARGRLREMLRDRSLLAPAAVITAAAAAGAAWVLLLPPGPLAEPTGTEYGVRTLLAIPLGHLNWLYVQAIGRIGWLDYGPPAFTLLAWTAVIGVILVLGLVLGSRRLAVAWVALLGIVLVVPTLLEASQINSYGVLFQGRYVLPLGVGLVLLAARAVDELPRDLLERLVPLTAGLLAVLVAGHVVALYFTARRFAVGVFGPVNIVTNPGWDPGIPLILPILGGSLALVALAAMVGRACRTAVLEPPRVELPPSDDEAPPVREETATAGVTYAGAPAH
jgi:Predicted membrane protein (DUF2142)